MFCFPEVQIYLDMMYFIFIFSLIYLISLGSEQIYKVVDIYS